MTDPILHILATIALCIDLLMLVGALALAWLLIRYRQALYLWYKHIKSLDAIYLIVTIKEQSE